MIPKLLSATLFLCLGTALCGQTILRNQADKAMAAWDYTTAIVLYQQFLTRHTDDVEVKAKLADCYRLVNDPEHAERWYAEVVQDTNCKPINKLYYGMMLQANGKCTEAKPWFAEYNREKPDDDRGRYLAQSCDQQELLLTKSRTSYVVAHLPINSNMDDFAPCVLGDRVLFASDRDPGGPFKRVNMWTGAPFCELYSMSFRRDTAHFGSFAWGKAERFSRSVNSKFHEASVTFSADTQAIYFTRNNYLDGKTGKSDDGQIKLKIYTGHHLGNNEWGPLQELPFCSDEYSTAHPSLSADGQRLFFASNKPGGYGGMDIYVSYREGDRWGLPINLGPEVNTAGNEIFPYISSENRLYFASNSHVGLGGLDIYYTTPKGKTAWNLPVNLGAPVNSNRDDFALVFAPEGDWGFFTSDREGGAGRDDIYVFQKGAATVEVLVVNSLNKKPLAGAMLQDKRSGLTMSTGPDGRVVFDMPLNECMDFTLSRKDFEPGKGQACTRGVVNGSTVKLNLTLERKTNNHLVGLVFDMLDGLPAEGVVVTLSNDCNKPEETFTTGADGRYRFKLAKNCCYRVRAVGEGYIADAVEGNCTLDLLPDEDIRADLSLQPYRDADGFVVKAPQSDDAPRYNEASGLYETPDGLPATIDFGDGLIIRKGVMFDNGTISMPAREGWARDRDGSGFLVNLYYDYNESNFRNESLPDLEKLLSMLRDNPELQVEIASHTDNRGNSDYNTALSQRRADTVVDWLAGKNIPRERLIARGYGESSPVSPCTACTEREHQLNRRTEFKVVGKVSGEKKAPCQGCPF